MEDPTNWDAELLAQVTADVAHESRNVLAIGPLLIMTGLDYSQSEEAFGAEQARQRGLRVESASWTLRGIRAKGVQPAVEVILLTGRGARESVEEGIGLGAFDYLMKPVKISTLFQVLSAAAERKRERQGKR